MPANFEPELLPPTTDQYDGPAREQLFAALYQELHRLAKRALRRDGGALSISTTTLLHEAYLNLAARTGSLSEPGRFLAYAARTMHSLMIDKVRRRRALKRGAGFVMTSLNLDREEEVDEERELTRESEAFRVPAREHDSVDISEALEALATVAPSLAELVELKYFCGLSLAEIGSLRGVSERTVQRDWEKARLFLFKSLAERDAP